MDLKSLLEEMASLQEEPLRPRLLAAARIGARLALQRIHIVAGGYVSGADVAIVERELDGIPAPTPVPPQPPQPAAPAPEPEPVSF